MRILVCLENDYRPYREVIAAGIQILRPHTEVDTAELCFLKEEVRHFGPHLVICSLPAAASYGDIVCGVQLSKESSSQPSVLCIDGRYSGASQVSFAHGGLLRVRRLGRARCSVRI